MNNNKFFLAFCILLVSQSANAFDNNREGFQLGIGIGNNYSFIKQSEGFGGIGDDLAGVTTSFKIGAGINNNTALYFIRNASFFSTQNYSFLIAMNGVGVSYYLSPSAPSGYFMAAIGAGEYQASSSSFFDYSGSAYMIGGGYEFIKHLQLEGAILNNDLKQDNGNDTLTTTTYQLTINYVWY